ncbi:MAG: ATP12 family protein [Sphingomonadaceae bacterium]
MRRFWKEVTVAPVDAGWQVALDGRLVRTPARLPLIVPNEQLATAIAGEWAAVEHEIRAGDMPLTGLANATIDHVLPDPAAFAGNLAIHAESDLVCYRAEHPQGLVARQAEAWDLPLATIERRFDVQFHRTAGISWVAQPAETLARIRAAFAGQSPWRLAPMQPLVTITGSAILALAVVENLLDSEAALAAGMVDELWQAEQWGMDAEAAAARDARARQYRDAIAFLRLL